MELSAGGKPGGKRGNGEMRAISVYAVCSNINLSELSLEMSYESVQRIISCFHLFLYW
jgi:hypothetical protein